MADYGLIGGLASGAQGFIQGMHDAEDRRYKRMEMEAKIAAQDEDRKRARFTDALSARSHGFMIPEGEDLYSMDPSKLKYDPQYIAMKNKLVGGVGPTTPGEISLDRDFAKDYSDYFASGGGEVVNKNLGLLQEGIDDLGEDGELSGGVTGYMGEYAQDAFNSKGAAVRDKIRTAIQSSLKQILGGQFTEKEAQAMFSRAYNPRLSDAENIRRATVELNALRSMASAKESAGKYFEEHGTLRGYRGTGLVGKGLIEKPSKEAKGDAAKKARLAELREKKQKAMTAGR